MEGADVKAGSEGAFGSGSELADFELPDFVGEGLAWPSDVAVHFVDDIEFGFGGVGQEVIDGLLATPFFLMDAGVNHQAEAAPEIIDELAEAVVGIVIQAEFVTEPLGVESPALDKSGEVQVAAELGMALLFLGEGDLKMMTRDGLVQSEGHHFPFGAHVRSVQIDGEGSGATAVGGGTSVVSGAGVRGGLGRDRFHSELAGGKGAKELRKPRLNFFDQVFVAALQLRAGIVKETGMGAESGEKLVERAAKAKRLLEFGELAEETFDLGETELVNLIGGEIRGGVVSSE